MRWGRTVCEGGAGCIIAEPEAHARVCQIEARHAKHQAPSAIPARRLRVSVDRSVHFMAAV
jgi:hypothetical protein